jgi:hypothetical protein
MFGQQWPEHQLVLESLSVGDQKVLFEQWTTWSARLPGPLGRWRDRRDRPLTGNQTHLLSLGMPTRKAGTSTTGKRFTGAVEEAIIRDLDHPIEGTLLLAGMGPRLVPDRDIDGNLQTD